MKSEIQVVEVKNKAQLKSFVLFPQQLYKDNPNFVPALLKDELEFWDNSKNPALSYTDYRLYLAYKNENIVGRIAVLFNKLEKEELGIEKIRFGWLDFIDDAAVSAALINKARDFAEEKNITKLEGPMGITNLDKAGMLTMGFDRLATMIGIYNHPYYPQHLEKLGFDKEKEWVEYEIEFPDALPEKVHKFSALLRDKYGLKVLRFKSKKEILRWVEPMFGLLDVTYRDLSTYTPFTQEQIKHYREKYFSLIDKDFIVCITDSDDRLIAFAITMPSYSKALQLSKGKLLPFGWFHFMRASASNDRANFYLIGIHPDYQRRGITSIIFEEIYRIFRAKGVRYLETNPELEENRNIQLLWQDYNPLNHKRRKTYSLNLR